MGCIHGVHRHAESLFPARLDDSIAAAHPVRCLDAFVEHLHLTRRGFQRATPAAPGRPAYAPAALWQLYRYGSLYPLRSRRRLAQETPRHGEVLGWFKQLRPDPKTSADLRTHNLQPLRQVWREFTVLCKQWDLFAGELVALDGSKCKAVNAQERHCTPDKRTPLRQQIDHRNAGSLQARDGQAPPDAAGTPGGAVADNVQAQHATLQHRTLRYPALQAQCAASGAPQRALTDPESRAMQLGQGHGTEVGYNEPTAVDRKPKFIIATDVTTDTGDRDCRSPMALQAPAILGGTASHRGYLCEIRPVAQAKVSGTMPP